MGDNSGCNNMESRQSYKTTYMVKAKGSERISVIFIFRLNIVLHNSYQGAEIVMEIEE